MIWLHKASLCLSEIGSGRKICNVERPTAQKENILLMSIYLFVRVCGVSIKVVNIFHSNSVFQWMKKKIYVADSTGVGLLSVRYPHKFNPRDYWLCLHMNWFFSISAKYNPNSVNLRTKAVTAMYEDKYVDNEDRSD